MFSRSWWNRELLDAAKEGDVDGMRVALQNGADVNRRDEDGYTPFMEACSWGKLEEVRFISSVPGIDLNAVNGNGRSAFHSASASGHLEVIRFLVTLPGIINITAQGNEGDTALHDAVAYARLLPLVQYLLSSDLGFDVEARNGDGESVLLAACSWGPRLEIVEYLLISCNSDVQTVDNEGNSCFHLAAAAEFCSMEVVPYLLRNYPEQNFVTKINSHGDTPFDLAIEEEQDEETLDYILTVVYKDQVLEQEGNRAIHAILDIAEYRHFVEDVE